MAFALGDGSVRLVDRRMTQDFIGKIDTSVLGDRDTVGRYKPYCIGTQPHKITSVQFNSVGSELLVSYSEDYVYLFNSHLFHVGSLRDRGSTVDSSAFITRPVYLSQLECYSPDRRRKQGSSVKRKPPSNYHHSPPTSSKSTAKGGSTPPPKKLRLRGDWSDTGPEARPESDTDGGRREGGHLMNRMSRMFARWIDMSLNPGSDNETSDREEVPGRYRRRRVPPPTTDRGASPTALSSSSSDNSFQLFDSDSEETVEEEKKEEKEKEGEGEREEELARGEERAKARDVHVSELREHPVALDSIDDNLTNALDTSNGSVCATKSEGVATMDLATSCDSSRSSVQAAAANDSVDDRGSVKHENSNEQSFAIEESNDVMCDTESKLIASDTGEAKRHDRNTADTSRTNCTPPASLELCESLDKEDNERTCAFDSQIEPTSINKEGEHVISHDQIDSVASNVEVTIENRTKKPFTVDSPAVVIEGETDSDDCDGGGSCDSYMIESRDNEVQLTSRYFMRYRGHRNSRTMVGVRGSQQGRMLVQSGQLHRSPSNIFIAQHRRG